MVSVKDNIISISTATLDAVMINGALVKLTDKSGRVYIDADESQAEVIRIVYRNGETVPVKTTPKGKIYTIPISDTCAVIRYDAWDGNGSITVTEDRETGDLCIEPEVTSARYGVLACRYYLDGITKGHRIVAPIFQGINMELDDKLIHERKWGWPHGWEAQLVILQNAGCGFWVHCEDDKYHCKSLTTGACKSASGLSFDSETWGPVERSLSAGGVTWRINVYDGDWQVPAERYRQWLWKTYDLAAEEKKRKSWVNDVKLGVSWCPSDKAVIDELKNKVDPKKVLLHLPNWRINGYDQCYPDFTPRENFIEFLEYAAALGFHCMPHSNSVDMDPSMPEYKYLCDFKYRSVDGGRFLGWGWENGHAIGVPSSNKALDESRDKLVMVKIHPGLQLWRTLLAEKIKAALDALKNKTDIIFIDVTLCSYNLDNCLVDNITSIEGMKLLINQVGMINGGIAVGGEGLNEITMQNQSFAQAHLFDSHQATAPDLARCGGCDLNTFLFGRLCRTIGYSSLSGKDEMQVLREKIHEEHGAIPTITIGGAKEIAEPNADFKRIFDMVNSGK